MWNRAFTLIELLIAFAISTVLAGAIYLFYLNFITVDNRTRLMVEIDRSADLFLEKFYQDLRRAEEILSLHGNEITFRQRVLPKGELSQSDLEQKIYHRVSYEAKNDKGRFTIERTEGLAAPKKVLECSKGNLEIFRGFTFVQSEKYKAIEKPIFKEFDALNQSSIEVARIALVSVKLKLFQRKLDKPLKVQSKVFLPNVYARLVEPGWNSEL